MVVSAIKPLSHIEAWSPKVIAIIGGMAWVQEGSPDMTPLLMGQYAKGAVVAGICGGTLALARAKLLDSTRHTSNDLAFLREYVKNYQGADDFQPSASAILNKRVITAPGTAPVSFAAKIFEAVGIERGEVEAFMQLMSAEHGSLG